MIETKKLIPQIYNTSYDFGLFEAILDVVFNSVDFKSKAIIGLHSPANCFEENLIKLAKNFNLETSNRLLLKQYRRLTKNKGTQEVLEAALYFCGVTRIANIDINYLLASRNLVISCYVDFAFFNNSLFKVLTDRLIPINCQVKIYPA